MKESQKTRILRLLGQRGWIHIERLNDICYRYGARLYELRKAGIGIVTRRSGGQGGKVHIYYELLTPNNEIDFIAAKLRSKV